jgi:hypothetical protein
MHRGRCRIVEHRAVQDGGALNPVHRVNRCPCTCEIVATQTYLTTDRHQSQKTGVYVEYVTVSEPSTIRTLRLARIVSTALPISVNVQDFFRGTRCADELLAFADDCLYSHRLILKFTISSTTHQHVQISSAHLEGPKEGSGDLQIRECTLQKRLVNVRLKLERRRTT